MLRQVRSGEYSYLVFPGPKATASEQGRDGFWFEIVTPSSTIPDLVNYLEYLRGEIKGNVLARFSELGHGSVGARATGDTQSEVWVDALHSVARHFASMNEQAIRRLVDMNYDVDDYPKLTVQDIESRSLTEFADAHYKLVSTGAIYPDASYRDFVRKTLGAPDEDDVDGNQQDPLAPPRPGEQQPVSDEDGPQFDPAKPKPKPDNNGDGNTDEEQRYSVELVRDQDGHITAATVINPDGDVEDAEPESNELLAALNEIALALRANLARPLPDIKLDPIVIVAPEQTAPRKVEIRRGGAGEITGATVTEQ